MTENTIRIPPQLQDFRFIRVNKDPARSKIPFDEKWQETRNYSADDPIIQQWLQEGGNYGVVGTPTKIILDADIPLLIDLIEDQLPETFTVQTGGGGRHYYYTIDIPFDRNLEIMAHKKNIGHIKTQGGFVVGPGSIHGKTGNKYIILKDLPITEIPKEKLETVLAPFLGKKHQIRPCLDKLIDEMVKDKKHYDHATNLHLATELKAAGYEDLVIYALFSYAVDYNEQKTRTQLKSLDVAKTATCATIQHLGHCLLEDCPTYKKRHEKTLKQPPKVECEEDHCIAAPITQEKIETESTSKSLFEQIINYFVVLYGVLGYYTSIACLISLMSQLLERSFRWGYRLRTHILLQWEASWTKSKLLRIIRDYLVPKEYFSLVNVLSATPATFVGSFEKNEFIPPIFLNDLIIIPELTTILQSVGNNQEQMGYFLAALEDGEVSISRVKFGPITQVDKRQVEADYPRISFEQNAKGGLINRFNYTCDFICWAATHTLENISKGYRDAFLSRFYVIKIDEVELTPELSVKVTSAHTRLDFNKLAKFQNELRKTFTPENIQAILSELNDGKAGQIEKFRDEFVLSHTQKTIDPRVSNLIVIFGICAYGYLRDIDLTLKWLEKYSLLLIKRDYRADEEKILAELTSGKLSEPELSKRTGIAKTTLRRKLEQMSQVRMIKDILDGHGTNVWERR